MSQAQALRGVVTDVETGKPINNATVTDLNSGRAFYSNEFGVFVAEAATGDILEFTNLGYKSVKRITPSALGTVLMKVEMSKNTVQLEEFVLHNLTQYQRDSIAMANAYSKELNLQAIKPKFVATGSGVGMNGLIGGAVQKISRSYKRNKKFKAEFKKSEEDKFIDTRYTGVLVSSLTGLPSEGDTLAAFMNTYPMDYDFARHATDLELKMWIRDNYKQYLHKKDTVANTAAKPAQ